MSDNFAWLQQFYLSLCDGEWEHRYGCDIGNLDNPGWSFRFELAGTRLAEAGGLDLKRGADTSESGHDWLVLKNDGPTVTGFCGPLKLDELVGEFRSWAERSDPQTAALGTA